MLDEIAFTVFAAAVLGLSCIVRPSRATCPPNWRQEGVGIHASAYRQRGEFSCNYYPYSETTRHFVLYPYRLRGRIWCADHETPIQTSDESVACRRIP